MAYNKVVYDGNTLIDLTDLDVTAGDVVSGVNFIMADGAKAVGTLQVHNIQTEDVLLADNITISGQTYGNGNASVSKTGYTPIGIVGMHLQNASTGGQNNTTCAMHSWYLRGSTAYWIVRGTSTATAKIKVTATILYVAT